MEKITLITCTYNRINHLKNLIHSLKNQTIKPDEFIISDDGSQEDIESFLRSEFKNEKEIKVKLIKQEDLGFRVARARNNGVREAKNELLMLIDSDVIMPPKFMEIFYKKRKKGVVNLSRAIRLTEESTEKITEKRIKENDFLDLYDKKLYNYNVERYYKNIFYSIFLKEKQAEKFRSMAFSMYKEDYIKVDGMDESFIGWGLEDVEFGLRLHAYNIKIKNSHRNIFQYHQWHGEYAGGENSKNILLDKIKNKNFKKLKNGYKNTLGNDSYKVIEIC